MKAAAVAVLVLLAAGAAAQSPQPTPPYVIGGLAQTPEKASPVLQVSDVQARLAALVPKAKAEGSAGATLVDYGSYKLQLSVRTQSGGAEVHAHWDDVMVVEAGSATLITGGTVAGAGTDADGETHGPKIEGGQMQTLAAGDTVTIRAGTPHQILLEPGVIYEALVVKVHEP